MKNVQIQIVTKSLTILLFLISFSSFNIFPQTVDQRIENILNQMTTAEKILQLHKEGGMNTADNLRLGIPGFVMADGPHGVRDGFATSFPVGISMAATWDVELAERIGKAMGEEFRAKGKHQMLGPAMDITRDPRNGRTPESSGEDPYLNAQITSAVTKGVQLTPCLATIKHFNLKHKQANRTNNNYTISQSLLMDHYGLNFRTSVQDAGAFSVMSAYNLINGEQAAENSNLLRTILREQWGFPYYVVSDWGGVKNTEKAVESGNDICMGSDHYQNDLPSLVSSGAVPIAVINEAVRNVLRTKILSGILDYYPVGNPDDLNSDAHKNLCLEAGKKSLVLLKNLNSVLPLNADLIDTIAVLGPNAAVLPTDGTGSSWVDPFYKVSPKEGIENRIGFEKVLYAKGCEITGSYAADLADALQKAQKADIVIYFGGLDQTQEGEGLDRANGSIKLPGKQIDFIKLLASVNSKVIVVLISGGICSVNDFINDIEGLIYAFYPGQEGGNAIAQVLFGDYNPAGRLPVTMPKNDAQYSSLITDFDFTNDYGCGYRYFDKLQIDPEFAFGYGLSYTTFSYSNLVVTPSSAPVGDIIEVSVDVTNTGSRDGEEVAQLYITDQASPKQILAKELKGFKRIHLSIGETKTVTFQISPNELYYFDEVTQSYKVAHGLYTVKVGPSSDSLPLQSTFELTNGALYPDLQIANIKIVPAYPLEGDKVQFLATVLNRGTTATPTDQPLEVIFKVNGIEISKYSELTESIPAGGMKLINGTIGINGDYSWTANEIADFTVQAEVNYLNAMSERITSNNSKTAAFKVYDTPPENLALRKPVIASSSEGTGLEGSKAVDGNYGTRWSSMFSDSQWLLIDLGSIQSFNQVRLYWETAYGKEYKIQISDNGLAWTDMVHKINGTGGIEKYDFQALARYIRIYGIKRATEWGYSLYEVEVFNLPAVDAKEEMKENLPNTFTLEQNYPNPFNPTTKIKYSIPTSPLNPTPYQGEGNTERLVILKVYDVLGREVATLVHEEKEAGYHLVDFNASDLPSGVYFYRLIAGNFIDTKKMLLVK
ncbi:MAG: glycoside hydrolase family 3 C-terminal domain-containing protein [Ignavibacteriaceae bacterium]|nr:glycoside hydrolase family 3 C-terminal domain-containing protein [Ignavibacteriaceae bacterium]